MVLEVIINGNGDILDFVNVPVDNTEIKYWDSGRVRYISGSDDRIKLTIRGIN